MPSKATVLKALFDVQPITKSGFLDLGKIEKVETKLNLRKSKEEVTAEMVSVRKKDVASLIAKSVGSVQNLQKPEAILTSVSESVLDKAGLLNEFEKALTETVDADVELAKAGARIFKFSSSKLKWRPVQRPRWSKTSHTYEAEKFKPVLREEFRREELKEVGLNPIVLPLSMPAEEMKSQAIAEYYSPAAREVEVLLKSYKKGENSFSFRTKKRRAVLKPSTFLRRSRLVSIALAGFAVFLVTFLGYRGGISVKNDILANGNEAVMSLQQAKENLSDFDFNKAADNFGEAYKNFDKASAVLDQFGASLFSSFSGLPGVSKITSAGDLTEAGKYLSKAGQNLSLAFAGLAEANPLARNSLAKTVADFREVLVYADKNVDRAVNLLANIDAAVLPEDKRQLVIDFKEKIPEFQKYIGNSIDYSDFLLGVIGSQGTKRYLLLLQNNSELRATGGFPGNYAVIDFQRGAISNILVDDIYNIDGQMKENIIPPKPLQHITPNWGMRDSNWFADFPASARKVIQMYKKDGGGDVDGVLTITPDVIAGILEIIGPIEMAEYKLSVDADNFLAQLQTEVEYGENRAQPKKIVKDLQPKLFAKITQQNKDGWAKIFRHLLAMVEQKHILMYLNDPELQKTAVENGLGGEVKKTGGDYLQITFSNVKGSKTDAMTESAFNLRTSLNDNGLVNHRLVINRIHNGGNHLLGFYNRPNPSYVRVYAPKGSVLEKIENHSLVDYRSLIGHDDFGFSRDPELAAQDAAEHPFNGVDVFEEGDKTVFGFWLVTKPKEKETVVLEYTSPFGGINQNNYRLFWQKQSGSKNDRVGFQFKTPAAKEIVSYSLPLKLIGKDVSADFDLSVDREIKLTLK